MAFIFMNWTKKFWFHQSPCQSLLSMSLSIDEYHKAISSCHPFQPFAWSHGFTFNFFFIYFIFISFLPQEKIFGCLTELYLLFWHSLFIGILKLPSRHWIQVWIIMNDLRSHCNEVFPFSFFPPTYQYKWHLKKSTK